MKTAIVGATGVLGRALVPQLVQSGIEVRLLVRNPEKARALFGDSIEIMQCDLLETPINERLPGMLDGCQAAVHIATAIPKNFTVPGALKTNNRLRTEGTASMLAACKTAGVQQYVQQSISLAYADHGDDWITEDTPLDTSPERTEISAPVIEMENMLHETPTSQLRWCILRGGTFTGPGTMQEQLIQRLRNRQERIPGEGRRFLSLVAVSDMAGAIKAALLKDPAGETLNINVEPLRQGEYLIRLAKAVHAAIPQRDPQLTPPPSIRCSNQHAREMLGWAPENPVIPNNEMPV